MNTRTLASVVLGMSLVVVGCEKSDSGTAPSGSSPAPAPTAATPAAPSASESPSATATPAIPAAPAVPAAATTMPSDAAATAAGAAGAAGAAAAATTQPVAPAEVQKMIDQALTYVKENKMELADKTLTQLESMKAQIPVEYHPKIDQARKAFTAAKAGGGNLGGLLPGGTAK